MKHRIKILCIDDNLVDLEFLKIITEDLALEKIAFDFSTDRPNIKTIKKYDGFIIDHYMPDLNGMELGSIIHKQDWTKPKMLLTGLSLLSPEILDARVFYDLVCEKGNADQTIMAIKGLIRQCARNKEKNV